VKLLLDTHVLIWLFEENPCLNSKARTLLADRAHALTVSVVSVWEISIKQALGRLQVPDNIVALLELNRVRLLPVSVEHAYAVRSLPLLHGDPFDRMLVTQALLEDLTIVTHDKNVQAYPVPCLMV